MSEKKNTTNLFCGIVGLPNVGKSTFFNAVTKKGAAAANYPFCTIDHNLGIVALPDSRLPILAEISESQHIIPAMVTFVDIAGLVKGAAQGEGLGNKFLANIRETDLIIHVVRCFEEEEIIHVSGKVDPIEDIETINIELILADLQMIDNILEKLHRKSKTDKELLPKLSSLKKARELLDQMKPIRSIIWSTEELEHLEEFSFLTAKKVIYLTNVAENDILNLHNPYVQQVCDYIQAEGALVFSICAKLEEELALLSPEESKEYLQSVGLEESGLDRLIRVAFQELGLITFLTTGKEETRAWTIRKGTTAAEAAGKIHSDFQKGFIRAEIIPFTDFVTCQGRTKAKEQGKARLEGKEYIMQDGDITTFYHN